MAEYMIRYTIDVAVQADSIEEAEKKSLEKLDTSIKDFIFSSDASELQKAAEALEFYANPENYLGICIESNAAHGTFSEDYGCVWVNNDHDHRHGRIARRAMSDEWWGAEPCEYFLGQVDELNIALGIEDDDAIHIIEEELDEQDADEALDDYLAKLVELSSNSNHIPLSIIEKED